VKIDIGTVASYYTGLIVMGRERNTMTALLTTLTVLVPTLIMGAAAHSPRDAQGNRVTRGRRTFTGDLRSFLHLGAY
jgi:hypothetical protein